ncbi:MAG: Ig-like domain-containing protein [Flavobacteriaceae bacterium]|jgi:alpha-tubulin suppressor-like RCC1 family protein|nr:Ig-like domain-containing protein [Flavobacteriaceae bacterium]
MKKFLIIPAILFAFTSLIFAQAPNIAWHHAFGGSNTENCFDIKQTSDGGYIAVGLVLSASIGTGTLTGLTGYGGNGDLYIIKLKEDGTMDWQKVYGCSGNDQANSVQQTSDGGYIVVGETGGGIPSFGNQPPIGGSYGPMDWWILKLDASGEVEWHRMVGTSPGSTPPPQECSAGGDEQANSVKQTPDGGYIIAGITSGVQGHFVSADDNDSNNTITDFNVDFHDGGRDFWVVKIDADGNFEWQNALGGGATPGSQINTCSGEDSAYAIDLTSDGNYIVAGETSTINNGDVSGVQFTGGTDMWIAKIRSTDDPNLGGDQRGDVIWQKVIGSNGDEAAYDIKAIPLPSGEEYIVAGYTMPPEFPEVLNLGNVIAPGTGHFEEDFLIVKLDSKGKIIKQIRLGGINQDIARSVGLTGDGGYIVAGRSNSSNSGEVNDHHGTFGEWDFWLAKLSYGLELQWTKSLGGTGNFDQGFAVQETEDGGYIVAGETNSIIANPEDPGGGSTGYNNTRGFIDWWIVKLLHDPEDNVLCNIFLAGGKHTGVLQPSNNSLWLWGDNTYGQLGDGTTIAQNRPRPLLTLDWAAFTMGKDFTIAVKTDGTLWAWGSNDFDGDSSNNDENTVYGKLGLGDAYNNVPFVSVPTQIGIEDDWADIVSGSGSNHAFALKNNRKLYGWGLNTSGQVGDGTTDNKNAPTPIPDPDLLATEWGMDYPGGATGISLNTIKSTGANHTLMLDLASGLWAWGGNEHGQLGLGSSAPAIVTVPTPVMDLTPFGDISFGEQITCISVSAGDGTSLANYNPQSPIGGAYIDEIILGWGDGSGGQLGDGLNQSYDIVTIIDDRGWWDSAQTQNGFSTAVPSILQPGIEEGLYMWGLNDEGQLGTGDDINLDVITRVDTDPWGVYDQFYGISYGVVRGPSLGGKHAIGQKAGIFDILYVWGDNSSGQLGLGDNVSRLTPAPLVFPKGFIDGPNTTVAVGGTIMITTVFGVDAVVGGYYSSDPNIATVNPTTGVVTGVAPGKVTISRLFDRFCGDETSPSSIAIEVIPSGIPVNPHLRIRIKQ